MRHMQGRVIWRVLLGLVLFALLAGAGVLWRDLSRFADAPLALHADEPTLVVPEGATFTRIVALLRARHVSAAPRLYWRLLAMRMRATDRLKAGEYALRPGLTPRALLDRMVRGKVVQHDFTIVDGWNFRELRSALAAKPDLRHTIGDMDDAALSRALGMEGHNPEGWFLPETYAFVRGDSDLDILRRSHAAMQTLLKRLWPGRDKGIPLETPYQALILASIVEKETGRADERARIAGVFERRLKRGMMLQTDPAVIYGMGSAYHGNIRKRDLTTDTPYNTYMHRGLPPTPIAMPGKPALQAVLHPAQGTALYFVARGDGSHVFSDTLAEHNRAVACFQLKRCAGYKR
jgi:UPF0755 protein